MGNIKIKTDKTHRFNRVVNIKGKTVQIDATGTAEVPSDLVVYALNAGFELVDKKATYLTQEELEQTESQQEVLASAKKAAEQIIADAELKAKQIIADAELKAKQIIADNNVEEKEAKRKALLNETNDSLKAALKDAGVEEKLWKDATKETLVNLIMDIVFK